MRQLVNIDLSRSIKIDDKFEITLGRLLLITFITLFQFLGIWCANGWILNPGMFFLVSNALLGLEKRADDKVDE